MKAWAWGRGPGHGGGDMRERTVEGEGSISSLLVVGPVLTTVMTYTQMERQHHTNCKKGDVASHVNAMGNIQALYMRFTRQICLDYSLRALTKQLDVKNL